MSVLSQQVERELDQLSKKDSGSQHELHGSMLTMLMFIQSSEEHKELMEKKAQQRMDKIETLIKDVKAYSERLEKVENSIAEYEKIKDKYIRSDSEGAIKVKEFTRFGLKIKDFFTTGLAILALTAVTVSQWEKVVEFFSKPDYVKKESPAKVTTEK